MHTRKCLVAITILFTYINTTLALDGLGTEASPWLIQSITDFDQFTANSDFWTDYTRLDVDIDLTGRTYTTAPIAPDPDTDSTWDGTPFTGTFNGNNHTISNLTINGGWYLGLFGCIDSGSVTNLPVENVNISATGNYIGGLCGYNYSGTINNCYATGAVTAGDGSSGLGGLCGCNYGAIISNSYATCSVTGGNISGHIGGLCGWNIYGTISNCYATGSVATGNDSGVLGGLCGYSSGTLRNCYAKGAITAGDSSGWIGGLCRINDGGTISNCFWDKESSGQITSNGGISKTTAQMKQAATYIAWNNGLWTIDEGNDYPHLLWEGKPNPVITTDYPARTYAGDGISQPFEIATADDLYRMSRRINDWDKKFVLTADIDMAAINDYWPMQDFTGSFDGSGYTINNLTIDINIIGNNFRLGLFGAIDGANVKDVGLTNIAIITRDHSGHLGGLCGRSDHSIINNCYVTGSVTAGVNSYTIGGLCGWSYDSTISNCYATGSVAAGDDSMRLGGLCGSIYGKISNCYTTSSVAGGVGSKNIGGLCGSISSGNITSCYSAGNVTGDGDNVGGFCGYSSGSPISQSFWNTQTSGTTDGVGNIDPDPTGVSGKTTTQMQDINTFLTANWDFVNVWDICNGFSYPKLIWQGPVATVIARNIFYNNSYFDNNDPLANNNDDNAIAPDKTALLPGQTATFANYTSYHRGINGIIIDIACLYGTPTADDFTFYLGNNNDPTTWLPAPTPSTITTRPGEGLNGSDRIIITWPDNTIQKQWLEITVLATDQTGLTEDDVFYFGNAPGDTGNKTTDANVNVLDLSGIRDNPRNIFNPAPIDNPHDINRDHNVNVLDCSVVRDNATNIFNALKLITIPQ